MKPLRVIATIRSACYRTGKVLGDVNAVARGPKAMAKRVGRRIYGKLAGRLMGRIFPPK